MLFHGRLTPTASFYNLEHRDYYLEFNLSKYGTISFRKFTTNTWKVSFLVNVVFLCNVFRQIVDIPKDTNPLKQLASQVNFTYMYIIKILSIKYRSAFIQEADRRKTFKFLQNWFFFHLKYVHINHRINAPKDVCGRGNYRMQSISVKHQRNLP